MQLFKFKLFKIKYSKKISVSYQHWPRFKCSVAICGLWLPMRCCIPATIGNYRQKQETALLIYDSANSSGFCFCFSKKFFAHLKTYWCLRYLDTVEFEIVDSLNYINYLKYMVQFPAFRNSELVWWNEPSYGQDKNVKSK